MFGLDSSEAANKSLKIFFEKKVNKILIAEDVYYPGDDELKEFYVGILLDRSNGKNVIMASTEGGVEIEKVAEETPEKIIKEWVDPNLGYGMGSG